MSARNLTTKDILQKEFKPALRGFNTEEVDEFLDLIIRDYESYEKELSYLKQENQRLKQQASHTNTHEPNSQSAHSVPNQATTNYDILKRLSKLEKVVYGQYSHPQDSEENYKQPDQDTHIYQGE